MSEPLALEPVAAVGPYFAVAGGDRPPAGEPFRPLSELYGDPEVLAGHVTEVGRRIGTGEGRVAASTLHIGTAARLWSVGLASAVLTGRVPDLAPETLWWRRPQSGPVELWLPEPRELPGDPVAALQETVTARNLAPFDAALRRHHGVSPQVSRGNSASALVGALRVLGARVPDAPRDPLPLVRELLARPPLAGTGPFRVAGDGAVVFRRRSCCLYYRAPRGGMCEECVLQGRTGGRASRRGRAGG
ncbi:(2Fe-2S)-binding protein [Streptomyces sp. LP05-1]|uniref:(2Fe-2S)-binding protein n=1 Tax=Streptomyces pyxinae TaxID=2970734 RepID=A0ABT2CFU7_9ACTN|nr:(2Fe-2S)-binding protein [Streptomyces sp. LP05-1]MCS0635581.1 (2Fe-2S)-binding protein [Streptomyces sp. LP05-1]